MADDDIEVPEIRYTGRRIDVFYWSCFIVGCGALVPWSSQLSAVDYFKRTYPVRPSELRYSVPSALSGP